MDESILFLSDQSSPDPTAEPSFEGALVADRDDAPLALDTRGYRAICLDRSRLESALADARWLRRRRNRLPVIALVDTRDVERAAELFACGVQEIVVRDASRDASLRAGIAGLVAPRRPAR